jgi:hypothetical protein
MKYYFITYQATNKQGTDSMWNQVINVSPMHFIKRISKIEEQGSRTYNSFVVVNTCEITKEQYEEFKDMF